jgi:hypothetical protein
VANQLFLFDPDPEAALPDLRRRTLTEAELALYLRRLQTDFDARTQFLHRCDECHGLVEAVDANGLCLECKQPLPTPRD